MPRKDRRRGNQKKRVTHPCSKEQNVMLFLGLWRRMTQMVLVKIPEQKQENEEKEKEQGLLLMVAVVAGEDVRR